MAWLHSQQRVSAILADPSGPCIELRRKVSAMTLVKICGITNRADLIAAAEAGADMLGFIFYPQSPRAVTLDQAANLTATLRSLDVPRLPQCIGVFVDPEPAELLSLLQICHLNAAQIHRASAEKLRQIAQVLHGACYPAVQAQSFDEIGAVMAIFKGETPSAPPWLPQLLLDAHHPHLAGGTGQRVDQGLARQAAQALSRLMLAGGLTPENVAETVQHVRPWAVDVSSGVEAERGRKDHGKMRAFIAAVRAASAD
ncbi:MAG: phosphoribosylanthranilate isomerase [Chloroflexota bacterium]|nr:MAG: phosphoribosylanthranilate isomerase [Chloroflexota bacterium]